MLGKKKKQNPISRFVNEIRQSRRGESLVVQTGFPTSLIDLVVKNRSRFVKSKTDCGRYEWLNRDTKNKDRRRPVPETNPETKKRENEDQDSRRIQEDHEKCPDQENQKIYHRQEDEEERKIYRQNYGDSGGLKGRFAKLVKTLFVLVLGLGTKKVAAAITLSAFALLLVEFLSRSCVGGKGGRECGEEKVEEEADLVDLSKEFENLVKENRVREIDIEIEIEIECDKDEQCGDKGEEGDRKKGVVIDGDERVLECEMVRCRKKSGGGKITAKQFRKYVTKKFGGDSKSRRRNKDAKKLARQNEQSNCDGDGEVESVGKESIGEEEQENDEEGDDVVEECESKCVSEVSSDVGSQDDIGRKPTNWNLKGFVLVVIILAGLVGGRVMAMVLSIVWFILVVALTKQRKSSATQKL